MEFKLIQIPFELQPHFLKLIKSWNLAQIQIMAKHEENQEMSLKGKRLITGENPKDQKGRQGRNGNNPFKWQEKCLGIFLSHGLLQRSIVQSFIPMGKTKNNAQY